MTMDLLGCQNCRRVGRAGMHRVRLSMLAIACLLASGASGPAKAQSELDLAACNARKAQHASLVANGVPEVMAKGPEWAKTNLGADKLGEILRFIQLEEDLKFRCEDIFAKAEAEAARQVREALRQAAKRAGVKVPPVPTKNPERQIVAAP